MASPGCRFDDLIAGLAGLKAEHERLQTELVQLRQQGPCQPPEPEELRKQGFVSDAPDVPGEVDTAQWTTSEDNLPCVAGESPSKTSATVVRDSLSVASVSSEAPAKRNRTLDLKSEWRAFDKGGDLSSSVNRANTAALGRKAMFRRAQTRMDQVEDMAGMVASGCHLKPIPPTCRERLYWDLAGLVLLSFDIVNVPLLAFDPPEHPVTVGIDRFILVFWTLDIALSFCSGYYQRETVILEWGKIAKHYIKSWFLLDLIIVMPDWVFTLSGQDSEGAQRLLRSIRFVRVLRLLRVVKLQRIMNQIYDWVDNEYSFILVELCKMMCSIVVLNHVLACGWFLIGKLAQSQGMPTWINWTENFWEAEMGYQYSTAMHWSLTQFTTASNDVSARNVFERTYSICVLFFGMFAFSTLVGTITASITALRSMSNDKRKSFWLLRRYLKQKGVSKELTNRMTRFLEHQQEKTERAVPESSVTFLTLISDQLKSELAHEMYGRSLRTHVFFRHISSEMDVIAFRICHTAVKALNLAAGDILFSMGEEASKTFITSTAGMKYRHSDPRLCVRGGLPEGEWIAEAGLWTVWRYHGQCLAGKPSEVLSIDAGHFATIMSSQWRPWAYARAYGSMFVDYLNMQDAKQRADIVKEEDFDFGEAASGALSSSSNEYPCVSPRGSEDPHREAKLAQSPLSERSSGAGAWAWAPEGAGAPRSGGLSAQ